MIFWIFLIACVLYVTVISYNTYFTIKYTKEGMIEGFSVLRKIISRYGHKGLIIYAIAEVSLNLFICNIIYIFVPELAIAVICFVLGFCVGVISLDRASIKVWKKKTKMERNTIARLAERINMYETITPDPIDDGYVDLSDIDESGMENTPEDSP